LTSMVFRILCTLWKGKKGVMGYEVIDEGSCMKQQRRNTDALRFLENAHVSQLQRGVMLSAASSASVLRYMTC